MLQDFMREVIKLEARNFDVVTKYSNSTNSFVCVGCYFRYGKRRISQPLIEHSKMTFFILRHLDEV